MKFKLNLSQPYFSDHRSLRCKNRTNKTNRKNLNYHIVGQLSLLQFVIFSVFKSQLIYSKRGKKYGGWYLRCRHKLAYLWGVSVIRNPTGVPDLTNRSFEWPQNSPERLMIRILLANYGGYGCAVRIPWGSQDRKWRLHQRVSSETRAVEYPYVCPVG